MAVIKEKAISVLKGFPKYKILDEIKENVKKEVSFFTTLETDSDPIQVKRNETNWKQTISYYLLHPEQFEFGLKHLK
jgi:hypothetical protein